MRIISLIFVFCLLAMVPVCYAEISEILLDDGSVIYAEVVSLNNGRYTLSSSILGNVSLDASRVRSVSRQGMAPLPGIPVPGQSTVPVTATPEFKAQLQDVQAALTGNPETMKIITDLSADPAFRALLTDPVTMAAITSGDIAKLKDDPKFNAIMQDPRMQELVGKAAIQSEKHD